MITIKASEIIDFIDNNLNVDSFKAEFILTPSEDGGMGSEERAIIVSGLNKKTMKVLAIEFHSIITEDIITIFTD